jgi:hypothetical protein
VSVENLDISANAGRTAFRAGIAGECGQCLHDKFATVIVVRFSTKRTGDV